MFDQLGAPDGFQVLAGLMFATITAGWLLLIARKIGFKEQVQNFVGVSTFLWVCSLC